jgi:nuclear pore complex protein Nup98-Nup96
VPKTLQLQLRATNIALDDFGVPFADADPGVLFQSFAELPWLDEAGEQHERSVWRLASVLWDPVSDLPTYQDASLELQSYVREKRRKELLSQLLQELVEKEADHSAQSASTPEEVAFAHLTAHRIEQACAVLLDGGDMRLATMLPMLGGDLHSRHRMGKQLRHWRNKGVLSEISVPVRAVYELLAGETCYSDGVKSPLEDATPSFYLAEYFGLDWKRVLALKFWYGCFEDEGICAAVEKYEGDVERHPGKVSIPQPWYLDPSDKREGAMDLLWGLLKLYSDDLLGLDEVLNPTNLGSSNTDYRLPWQLRTILAKRGVRDFPGGELAEDGFSFLAGAHADQVTSDFAGSLENAGLWEWAIFVMMHVRGSDSRASAIKTIIARHVDDIEDGDKSAFLEKTLSIPRVWIYEAKALQARYANEHLLEAEYLISAKAWNEAHKTIVQQVAPEAIIVGDLEDLRKILGKFEHLEQIQGWGPGGQVYQDYIRLLGIIRMGPSPKNKEAQREVAKRLLGALKNMERTGPLQNIAVREMAGVVGSWILKTGDMVGST